MSYKYLILGLLSERPMSGYDIKKQVKSALGAVNPAAKLGLDSALLERFPEGYRHLAYLQTQIGYKVKPDMPGLKGPEVEALYARGHGWLNGKGL